MITYILGGITIYFCVLVWTSERSGIAKALMVPWFFLAVFSMTLRMFIDGLF